MLLTPDVLKDLLGTVALMALLGVAYGTVICTFTRLAAGQAVLGTLFGGVAVLAMFDPLLVAPGVIVDLRIVPVVLAGAFLGGPGAAVTVLVTLAGRAAIGGVGLTSGAVGIVSALLASLVWARLVGRKPRRSQRDVVLLALLSLAHLPAILLLPHDLAWRIATMVWPFFVPCQLAGVLIVGALLERERQIASEKTRLSQAAQAGGAVSVVLFDVDHFKRINDAWGHAMGDQVLRRIATSAGSATREGELVGRIGGEEFLIVLPGADWAAAVATAERIRGAIQADADQPDAGPAVAASFGVATLLCHETSDTVLQRADRALYAAKQAGRNTVRHAA